jgi:Fe-Mn family superoxide dismutase
MAYTLPPLPYAPDALVPHIDAKTMEIHHGKHHQAYITNATNLLKDHADLAALEVNALIADLSKVPEAIRGGVRNNAGGHSNHAFFWTIMGPGKGGAPKGTLAAAIEAQLGGFAKFKEDFAKAGATRFGSGWAWLYVTADKKLAVGSTANQAAAALAEGAPRGVRSQVHHSVASVGPVRTRACPRQWAATARPR